jgi:hypothetical protein
MWFAAARRQHRFKSKHEYTLEEFGLSAGWIRQELGPLLAAYGLESEGEPCQTKAPVSRPARANQAPFSPPPPYPAGAS